MLLPLPQILDYLLRYRYLILFPIAVIEGPIITVLAGFLVSTGQMNFWIAYLLVAVGDVFGDALYYFVGRYGKDTILVKYGKFFGITPERLSRLDAYYRKHGRKTLIIGKLTHSFGSIVLISAGVAKADFWEFIIINTLGTLPKSLALLLIGYFFGHAYQTINAYIDYTAYIIIALGIIAAVIIYSLVQRRKNKKQL